MSNKTSHHSFLSLMTPSASSSCAAHGGLRQTVRLPRESDGVGNALRQIFSGGSTLPADLRALLNRLKDD
jgi:hypothetical protein